jgi:tetratricopeptide (TPR) repeat protein/TolB-like protein
VKPGDTIGRYRIVARIGKGGMGEVYRAEDTRLQRPVALKFLPWDSLTEHGKYRFLNEARAAALARHPNICPIYDIEEADGELFIAMACLEGDTLARKIAWGPLTPPQAANIAAQIAAGLACAHGLGIVHRDIKTSNIMIDASGHVSIMDFGLALSSDAVRVTGEGASVGTPAYMSPEQARGEEVDARTDLWSLGVVLFEMLTAQLPFRREHRAALIHAILNDPIPDTGTELQPIVAKALARDPAARWQSANEMLAALKPAPDAGLTQTLIGTAPAAARASAASTTRGGAVAPARRRGRVAAIVASVVLALGAAALYQFRGASPPAGLPSSKQIAVLPFQAIGSVESTRAVADGLAEVLGAALAEHAGVTVVAAADLHRHSIDTAEGARRYYGSNLALSGAAQPAGDKVEFTVKLLDAVKPRQIDSRTFLYDPKDPLVSRDQAVGQVLRMMKLDVPAPARAAAGDTPAPDAYSAYLEGRGFLARYDLAANIDKAIASFTTATRQDPKYALAFGGLAESYWRKARGTGDKRWSTLANQNAEYAVQLDGSLPIVHSVLGAVYRDAGRQADAIREFQRAMELAPANAEAPRQLAEIYKDLGRFDEAEALYLRSTKSRPTDWYGHLLLGLFYYERERYPEAEAELNQAKSLTPDNDVVRVDLGAVYRMQGRYRDAIGEFQQALRIHSSGATYAALGGSYFYEHRFPEAVAALETAIDLNSSNYRYWGNLGIYYRWAPGNEAKSTAALHRAIELALQSAETTQSDYSVHANLAEYRARLGEGKAALAEIERIPVTARGPLTTRIAIVYELTGHRNQAIAAIRANLKSPASLNQIKDDPDLAALWRAGNFQ